MNVLIIISSKSPNPSLYNCISSLYKIQMNDENKYKLCVVDSDSDDLSNYSIIQQDFPEVDICFVKNKNYEYGAWKYGYEKYLDYDRYFCIQDNVIIVSKIDLSVINNKTVYTYHHPSGFIHQMSTKEKGIMYLNNTGLDYESIIDTPFTIACCNIFIITNDIIQDIFLTLREPPINKMDSTMYERLFGLYFIIKQIDTIDLTQFINKTGGKRQ
jgi:hypothetical protein